VSLEHEGRAAVAVPRGHGMELVTRGWCREAQGSGSSHGRVWRDLPGDRPVWGRVCCSSGGSRLAGTKCGGPTCRDTVILGESWV